MAMFRSGRSLRFLAACALSTCAQALYTRTDCASGWSTFAAEHSLVSTQRIPNPRTREEFDDHFVEGVTAFPDERFAYCGISKDGVSEWKQVLPKIAAHDASAVKDYGIDEETTSSDLMKVFSDPGAVRAVFVREPLSRFVSAYLGKCFSGNCTNEHCYARPESMRGKPTRFKDVVSWMLKSDPASVNNHWQLQSEHCELRTRISEYTIIGLVKKETFAQDSRCILEKAGLEKYDAKGDGSGEPVFIDALPGSDKDEEEVLKKLFTPDAARSLIAHLRQDYETFNFPAEPSWVAEATGEWFDYIPPQSSCGLIKGGLESNAYESETTPDDIVAMAAMAGFPNA